MIFNATTNRYEVNVGTDASPSWQQVLLSPDVLQLPIGGMVDYAGAGDVSSSLILCDGRELDRTTYATLFSAIGTGYGPGNGTSTFNIPDYRGRTSVGPDNMGTAKGAANRLTTSLKVLGQAGGEEFHVNLIVEMPAHDHGGATGIQAAVNTGTQSAFHQHSINALVKTFVDFQGGVSGGLGDVTMTGSFEAGHVSNESTNHVHQVPAHSHTISPQGGNAGHNNMQPYAVANKLIRVL